MLDVIKDQFPSILVEEVKDTLKDGIRYFSGSVADDHGLNNLTFVYEITGENGSKRTEKMNAGKLKELNFCILMLNVVKGNSHMIFFYKNKI